MGADKMLVKPMHTRVLLEQIENLLASHEAKLSIWSTPAPAKTAAGKAPKSAQKHAQKSAVRKTPKKKGATKVPLKQNSRVAAKSPVKKTRAKSAKKK
jgi:DNA-binding response OmpR family regulator